VSPRVCSVIFQPLLLEKTNGQLLSFGELLAVEQIDPIRRKSKQYDAHNDDFRPLETLGTELNRGAGLGCYSHRQGTVATCDNGLGFLSSR